MDFQIINWWDGTVVETFTYKGGRHRARINRKVAKMNDDKGYNVFHIVNV